MPLVRIKPHNPKKGCVMRSYTDLRLGMRFRVERGWYEVNESTAKRLSKVRMRDGDIDSPRAFDIAEDKEEAREVEEYYRAAATKEKGEESNPGSVDEPLRVHRPGRRSSSSSSSKTETKRETDPAPVGDEQGDDDGGGDLTTGELGGAEDGDEDETPGGDGETESQDAESQDAESGAETKPRGRRKKAATVRQKGKS